jgi:hypothetical protein
VRSSPVEVKVPRGQEKNDQVAADKRSKDTQVPPPVIERVSKRLVKLVSNLVRAILAYVGRVVQKVTWCTAAKEVGHVVSAVLALRRAERVEFASCALDFAAVKFGDDHTADQTCEGVELVEPDTPEFGNLGLGNGDTAEEREDDDDLS